MNVKDSVAVITGGSSGIGLALAKQLIALGAKGVVITGRNKERIEKAAHELSVDNASNAKILGIQCDANSWEENVSLMKATNEAFGCIDYVFANATGSGNDETPHDLFSKPNFESTYAMVDSLNYTIHAAVPYLASSTSTPVNTSKEKPEGGPGRDRAIIITGSEASFAGYDPSPRYGVAKAAFNSLTFATKSHLGALGIRINCLAPGWIDTPMLKDMVDLGILDSSDFIPMQVVVDALLRFVNNSALSGVVTRIPTRFHVPFDVVAEPQVKSSLDYWAPFLEKVRLAASGQLNKS